MAIWVKCDNCGKDFRAESLSFDDVGTFWEPKLSINCQFCKSPIIRKLPSNSLLDQADVNPIDKDGATAVRIGDSKSRAESADIYEEYVQKYFSQHYEKYGFSEIEGPFRIGPDFIGYHGNYKKKGNHSQGYPPALGDP